MPDGGMLENPNLIRPGWILRLPLDGRLEPAPLPLRLKHHIVPRRTVRRHRHVVAPTAQTAVARAMRHPQTPALHPPRPEPPVVHATHQPLLHQERHPQEHMLRPVRARPHLQPPPPARSAQRPAPRSVRPKRHVHPRPLHARSVRRGVSIRPPVVAAHPRVPGTCPPPGQSPMVVPPVTRLPDSDRLLPLALVLGLLSLCTLLARYRAAGSLARAARAGQWVVPSMQRALLAAQGGAQGLLERPLRRAAVTTWGHGNVVAHVLAALAAAGRHAGAPVNLARLTRRVTESQQAVSVLVEVRRLSDDLLAQVTAALQTMLGTPVQVERSVADGGMPCVRLTLKRTGLAVSADGWGPGQGRPHPAPLLVPVGHADGTVVHLNLGRSGAALVAGGTQGATTLVATLLAGSVIQAHPRELRLLVASADDELRGILPVLEHLEAPPADAGDVAAMAALVDQAYGVVVERFTAGEDAPAGPAYLLVLDRVETLRANRRALDRLDVICRNGHLCDVHVLATTAAPALLEEEGLLASFPTRLLRRLSPEESALLCGDARASTLDVRELVVQAGGQAPLHLSLFTLTVPEVRDLCARLATLLAVEAAGPGPVLTPPADAGVDADTTPPEVNTPAATLAPAAAPDMATAPVGRAGTASPATTPTGCELDRGTEAAVPDQPAADAREAPAARTASGSAVEGARAPEEASHRATPADGDGRLPTRLAVPRSHGAPPAAPITVTVFGQISASVGEREIALEGQHRRVLAALAIMGPKRVRAERLYNALFPDLPDEHANRLLITTISALRHRLRKAAGLSKTHDPDPLLRDSTGYALNPALVHVDSNAFQELLARSRAASPEEQGDLLVQAVALYRGDLCGDQEMEWLIDVIGRSGPPTGGRGGGDLNADAAALAIVWLARGLHPF
jgi:hypothetical protein